MMVGKSICCIALLFFLSSCTTQTDYFISKEIGIESESTSGLFSRSDKRIIKGFYSDHYNKPSHQQYDEIIVGEKIPSNIGRLPLPAELRRKLTKKSRGFMRYQVFNAIVSVDLNNQLVVDKVRIK